MVLVVGVAPCRLANSNCFSWAFVLFTPEGEDGLSLDTLSVDTMLSASRARCVIIQPRGPHNGRPVTRMRSTEVRRQGSAAC